MNVKEIKTLVGIMEDSSLTALEIEVPDLKLHGRQAHRLFFSGKDGRNTGFHRALGCLHPEQLIHGGDDGVVDVALIQSGRLLTDLPAMSRFWHRQTTRLTPFCVQITRR